VKNRVYYGEYSLRHWIELILRRNVILPEYQRHFVWNEKKVESLIVSLKNKQFIPPVTIGSFNKEGDTNNLILDGQQRLTSILLAYIGIYPDISVFKKTFQKFADENDDFDEDDIPGDEPEHFGLDNILEWNINELTKKGSTKEGIKKEITSGNYKSIDLDVNPEFFDENYLGFCYLVPHSDDVNEQQRYYSSVFRNINIQGQVLLPQESRAALYFLNQELLPFFSPKFFEKVKITLISNKAQADFLRYLALLSQYHGRRDSSHVARGYKQKMEALYELYIYAAINDEETKLFPRFTSVFPDKKYIERLESLDGIMESLKLYRSYSSIIDVDIYLFGVIYHVLFKGKKVNIDCSQEIEQEIKTTIDKYKEDQSHHKSPNNLKHLRTRIAKSISIYGDYIIP